MFEYLSALIGMHHVDGLITSVQAEETPPAIVRQASPPRPIYRISRDQRIETIRKRFEQQQKNDEKTPDPYQDMWDPNWINKP